MGCWTRKARTTHSVALITFVVFLKRQGVGKLWPVGQNEFTVYFCMAHRPQFLHLFVCFKDKVQSQSEWAWLKMGVTRPWSDFTQFLPSQKGWPLSYEAVFGGKLQSRKLYMWGWGPWVYVCVWSCAQRFFRRDQRTALDNWFFPSLYFWGTICFVLSTGLHAAFLMLGAQQASSRFSYFCSSSCQKEC